MTYDAHGKGILEVEVTNVSTHGFWVLVRDEEHFLSFDTFPWFKEAPIGKLVRVKLVSATHLHWPELDVDLELDSILHPEHFPLVSGVVREAGERYAADGAQAKWDEEKIDECVLALLHLTLHDGVRCWKRFDFEAMDRLFRKGYIEDPRGKTKSIVLTRKGLHRSQALFAELFRSPPGT